MKDFISFLRKDLLIEYREKGILSAACMLSLMLNLFFGMSLSRALLPQSTLIKTVPAVFLVVSVIVLFLSIERTFDAERRTMSFERFLILEKRNPVSFFLSKLCIVFIISVLTFFFSSLLLTVFSGSLIMPFWVIAPLALPLSLSVASLGICLGAMTSESGLKFILIVILGVPLLSPLFFSLLEALFDGIVKNESIFLSPWFHTALCLSGVYVLSSVFVFKRIIHE